MQDNGGLQIIGVRKWTFEDAGNGYYRIKNMNSGLYLEIENQSKEMEQKLYNVNIVIEHRNYGSLLKLVMVTIL